MIGILVRPHIEAEHPWKEMKHRSQSKPPQRSVILTTQGPLFSSASKPPYGEWSLRAAAHGPPSSSSGTQTVPQRCRRQQLPPRHHHLLLPNGAAALPMRFDKSSIMDSKRVVSLEGHQPFSRQPPDAKPRQRSIFSANLRHILSTYVPRGTLRSALLGCGRGRSG
jgi:hypothetical protein